MERNDTSAVDDGASERDTPLGDAMEETAELCTELAENMRQLQDALERFGEVGSDGEPGDRESHGPYGAVPADGGSAAAD